MVAFLVKKKGGSIPAELGNPVVFTRDYVKHCLLSKTTYGQGTSGLVTKVHKGFLCGSRTWTSAYRMVCSSGSAHRLLHSLVLRAGSPAPMRRLQSEWLPALLVMPGVWARPPMERGPGCS